MNALFGAAALFNLRVRCTLFRTLSFVQQADLMGQLCEITGAATAHTHVNFA